jgi:hypothetical protein
MDFKVNKSYSNRTIAKHCKNLQSSGQLIGGEHTIENENYKFVMLLNGAWRGGKSIYYKLETIKKQDDK